MATIERFQHVRSANAHSARDPVSWVTLGPNVSLIPRCLLLLPLSLLAQTSRPTTTPVTVDQTACAPSTSITDCTRSAPTPASTTANSATNTTTSLIPTPPMGRRRTSHQPPPSPPAPSPPTMWTQSIPDLTATAQLPHASAWPVTCKSILQRLVNLCLQHRPTLAASTHIAHAHPLTA
ncbi:hypothetical protein SprV_0602083900 [Sparganum proliferum]